MSQPPDPSAGDGCALPSYWPSAWPSLRGRVALAVVFPLVTCVVASVIFVLTGVLLVAWWVAALPLLLLIAPLTLPSRARAAIQDASDRQDLRVTPAAGGLVVQSPRRRRGTRPTALVEATPDGGFEVRYRVG